MTYGESSYGDREYAGQPQAEVLVEAAGTITSIAAADIGASSIATASTDGSSQQTQTTTDRSGETTRSDDGSVISIGQATVTPTLQTSSTTESATIVTPSTAANLVLTDADENTRRVDDANVTIAELSVRVSKEKAFAATDSSQISANTVIKSVDENILSVGGASLSQTVTTASGGATISQSIDTATVAESTVFTNLESIRAITGAIEQAIRSDALSFSNESADTSTTSDTATISVGNASSTTSSSVSVSSEDGQLIDTTGITTIGASSSLSLDLSTATQSVTAQLESVERTSSAELVDGVESSAATIASDTTTVSKDSPLLKEVGGAAIEADDSTNAITASTVSAVVAPPFSTDERTTSGDTATLSFADSTTAVPIDTSTSTESISLRKLQTATTLSPKEGSIVTSATLIPQSSLANSSKSLNRYRRISLPCKYYSNIT